MKYSEVEQYINSIPKFTKKNSMDHTKRFMELLEVTDKKMKIIHVAGTNGKGSTCAYMNGILYGMDKKVGMFTSPHLEHMTERIRVSGRDISEQDFVDTFQNVMEVVEIMKAEGLPHPTFFEFLLGMGMKAFAVNGMEYVILETGLGGRLDATNVFAQPIATVITSIGMDHEAYLGDTIEKIAGEKAGIIKQNVPVFYDDQLDEVSGVIERIAKVHCAPCKKISDFAHEIIEKNEKYIAFYMKDEYDKTVIWKIRKRGNYQVENAALALATLMTVIPEEDRNYRKWAQSLFMTEWPGRMDEVERGIFIDGAHNVSALEAVAKECQEVDVLLFSAVSDKNYEQMVEILTSKIRTKVYIVTTIDDSRGVPAKELGKLIQTKVEEPVYVVDEIREAWKLLHELKSEDGRALCLGSLYLVGMIKELNRNPRIKE